MSDEELFVAYRGGDEAALEALVERIKAPLFRTILRHVRDVQHAEDILQDTIERIIRHKSRYDPSKPFRGWAWSIAINRSLDHLRRRGREILTGEIIEPADHATPESESAGRETFARLKEALRALPAEQRKVFLMREEAGMSFAEIAKSLGAPLGTVLSRMHYALSKLRDAIGEKP